MHPVTIYTTNYCPYCVRAKELLCQRGVDFHEVDVTNDPQKREWLVTASGGRRTVPQIFVHGKPIGGCNDLHALDASGQLAQLLAMPMNP
ncbi:glutaredoxin 3 [Pajaroellobacter abortibovis]|uniref:Glutaredoxin n=1 Tax=Pajaroellobacter abortibovis TaxID=1882918 RepID=A0A1L6MYL8_9BACT|nr:glutaredoxin 3 [Pajaroellobacter abortibovis]APS00596.1 glutaredoxin 3 [Pajaroellobacter abortibovis]